MNWTTRSILGVMIIGAVWAFGFYGLDFVVSGQTGHHHGERMADWQLISIVVLYVAAGPGVVAVWVRWAGRKSAEDHEEGTLERIGALRVTVADQGVGRIRRKPGARCLRQ